jgi:hypothetical protein
MAVFPDQTITEYYVIIFLDFQTLGLFSLSPVLIERYRRHRVLRVPAPGLHIHPGIPGSELPVKQIYNLENKLNLLIAVVTNLSFRCNQTINEE